MDAVSLAVAAALSRRGGGGGADANAVHYTADSGKTDAEKAKAQQNLTITKTALDSVLVPLANYFLGEQSNLTLTLPTTGMSAGQTISVVFYSNTTATTLNIVGDFLGDSPTISTNQRAELNFLYDGIYWMLLSNVVAVPQDEVSV